MSEIIEELPVTYQSPTMAPFCKDEEKYSVVDELVKKFQQVKRDQIKIDDQPLVVYQGFSIHGNEPSGSNASLLMAYHLAARFISMDRVTLINNSWHVFKIILNFI